MARSEPTGLFLMNVETVELGKQVPHFAHGLRVRCVFCMSFLVEWDLSISTRGTFKTQCRRCRRHILVNIDDAKVAMEELPRIKQ